MFSPPVKKHIFSSLKDRNLGHELPASPATPLPDNQNSSSPLGTSIPNRPNTGTPAPWASRLSVLARIPQLKESEKGTDADPRKPVYVGEFPEEVRDAQSSYPQKSAQGDSLILIICGKRLFVWNYLSPAPSKKCIVLDIPPSVSDGGDKSSIATDGKTWMVSVVDWDSRSGTKYKVVQQCKSADNYNTWWWKTTPNRSRQYRGLEKASLSATVSFNSLITSAIPVTGCFLCLALACCSSGEVWQFQCSPTGISQKKIPLSFHNSANQSIDNGQPYRQFFLLTDHEIHCFNVNFTPELNVSMLWSHEIIGKDSDLGVKKDLAGQKQIWPVDMQVDEHGKEIMILIATFCKDRMSSSRYTQYSILTMQYKLEWIILPEISCSTGKGVREKCPIQVIIPKARVEDEDFLFSMRLRAGGSLLDQQSYFLVMELQQWCLGRLTEQAGVWAIPEKAVILGGVEPPERSVSRKGSSNEVGLLYRSVQDEESEALLGRLFHDFLLSGDVDSSLEKLSKSGSFEKDGETNVFAFARATEIVAMAVMSSQLLDKQQKHQRFLQFLALSCHEELSSKQRYTLQTIMEHGEKLAGMIQLRELQNLLNQNSSDGTSSASKPPNEMAGSLWDLIQLVGERATDNAEVFYSKVSDLEQVFHCLSYQLEYIISGDQPYIHHTWYPSLESLTPWYCQLVVRNGLWSVADFMLQLLKEATDLSAKSDLYSHLEGLADVLLETYSGAITAKLERGEEHKGLLDEYWNRRDVLLDSLYQLIKGFAEARYQNFSEGVEEPMELILRELSSPLLSIARRHESYISLWNICCDLNDIVLLRSLMHESLGPRGGFSYYVFEQLYQSRQFGKLLRLGEEFQEELAIFLKQHKDLLWLHEMFLNQFSSASVTLHALALFQEDDSASASENGLDVDIVRSEQSLADRKRLLHLSKISALAGRDSDFEIKTRRIEADLKILMLQEVIVRLLSDNEEKQDCDRLLPPGDLIELCLRVKSQNYHCWHLTYLHGPAPPFSKSSRSLFEECWKNAADQDDWGKLYQSVERNCSLSRLQTSVGPEAETYEGGFEEVMPLQRIMSWLPWKDNTGLTVEGILIWMLTAINLGKLGAEMVVEEDGPTPME
ncbi:hypothetical protein MKW92_051961 [Papaver armeniacum]|nr:hypothetical protein MKW92_051961 [Papaver armeniacum]